MHHHAKTVAVQTWPLMDQAFAWMMKDPKNALIAVLGFVLAIIILRWVVMQRRIHGFGEIFGHEPNIHPERRKNQQGMVSSRIVEIRSETDRLEEELKETEKAFLEARDSLRQAQHLEARAEKSARRWGFEIPEAEG